MAKRTAKATAKKTTKVSKKASGRRTAAAGEGAAPARRAAGGGRAAGSGRSKQSYKSGDAKGKHLVIVESPSKAKTINKYLGDEYVVLASIGHVRDLPAKNPKGDKSPVPGVDLKHRFKPSYTILDGKESVVRDLKRAATDAISTGGQVWFATDLDREGEAIAWHLAQELGIASADAKRVIFSAITKAEIAKAFSNPHAIDEDRVNAQQARRILDRIVGYQVSPLLWKKVARGLSAGRVQSVAVRVVVEREREIRAFIPDEHWAINANFALDRATADKLGPQWQKLLATRDEKGNGPLVKDLNGWLAKHGGIRAELVEYDGKAFDPKIDVAKLIGPADDLTRAGINARLEKAKKAFADPKSNALTPFVEQVAKACGLNDASSSVDVNEDGLGPARWVRTISGIADPAVPYTVRSIETKRTKSRPAPPFITSTLQQAASTRLGFGAQRTMRAAQALYEGVDMPGEGPVGLITYMRSDSTFISPEAVEMARTFVRNRFGDDYLPDKPVFYKSSNKDAQEAHEAIRPTSVARHPDDLPKNLKPDQARLYRLIWERFVACQMMPAEWDSTSVRIEGGRDGKAVFRATGRTLVFDGFYKVTGVPTSGDELNLPTLKQEQPLHAFDIAAQQKFSSPPARYSEASLIKVLESEGIGRPSTYAAIIQTIQDRKYVELVERRMFATDLGEVVTDKLIEAFPRIMDVGYTREMEAELDKVEDEHLDWIEMLTRFYGPFTEALAKAEGELQHAKAETVPAPEQYRCQKCGSSLVYRFGKNGRFLSCSTYPECDYACPVDRLGKPRPNELVNVQCPKTGRPMVRRNGRFGPFLATLQQDGEPQNFGIILNIDKKGKVTAPSQPPLLTELECNLCGTALNLRNGARGPWLGCSNFPKCRGRGKWAELPEAQKTQLETALAEHDRSHPIPIITTLDGKPLTDKSGKPTADAPTIDQLVIEEDDVKRLTAGARSVA